MHSTITKSSPNKQTATAAYVLRHWENARLYETPEVFPAATREPGVKALFYEGIPFKKRPTRVFAYYGVPEKKPAAGKWPAMVLVHGGRGSAYAEWVRQWISRGYAAIAMDHFGCVPDAAPPGEPYRFDTSTHKYSGPPGASVFEQTGEPVDDQWMFHAVAATVRANSLLRSLPEIDDSRIGVTGISWGGVVAAIAASIDQRFRFVVPVYGCGYMTQGSKYFVSAAAGVARRELNRWEALWDPFNYIERLEIPSLWVNSTNDTAFSFDSWNCSLELLPGEVWRSVQPGLPHGQHAGATPAEVAVFADFIMRDGTSLPEVQFVKPPIVKEAVLKVESTTPICKAELWFTTDVGEWMTRSWQRSDLPPLDAAGCLHVSINPTATAFFVNVQDERGCTVSSKVVKGGHAHD